MKPTSLPGLFKPDPPPPPILYGCDHPGCRALHGNYGFGPPLRSRLVRFCAEHLPPEERDHLAVFRETLP